MQEKLIHKNIVLCKKGRPEGFAWLLENYGPRLYSYFLRLTGSAEAAEDLLQDIFVKLIERIKDYRHQGRFEHWLFKVAANLERDRVRAIKRSPPTVTLKDDSQGQYRDEFEPAVTTEPGEQIERAETIERLQWAINQLPKDQREIVLARHYGQLSFKELAEQFEMPIGTVLAKVHRGLKQLKKLLERPTK